MKKEWELIKNIYGCTTILMQEEEAKETKNAFEVIEKSLKALEIIKEKAVDVYILFDLGLEEYNKYVLKRYGTYYQLTQEEFNLLKEVLE